MTNDQRPKTNDQRLMITVLSGGGGGVKFLKGLAQCMDPTQIVAVVNTGDDFILHGLYISPDVDSTLYSLSDQINPETGWGQKDESWRVMGALEKLEGETWFKLGDRDLATHLYRTQRLFLGEDLAKVTSQIAKAFKVKVNILPMTCDRVSTFLQVDLDSFDSSQCKSDCLSFQEYFVKYKCNPKVTSISFETSCNPMPTHGIIEALDRSEAIIIGPSNPFLSIDPILSIKAIREKLVSYREKVIAISPIVDGKSLKGPLSKLLIELGKKSDVVSIARHLSTVASVFVIDSSDGSFRKELTDLNLAVATTNTVMDTETDKVAVAKFVMTKVLAQIGK